MRRVREQPDRKELKARIGAQNSLYCPPHSLAGKVVWSTYPARAQGLKRSHCSTTDTLYSSAVFVLDAGLETVGCLMLARSSCHRKTINPGYYVPGVV